MLVASAGECVLEVVEVDAVSRDEAAREALSELEGGSVDVLSETVSFEVLS